MIEPISRKYGRSLLINNKSSLNNWKILFLKTSLFVLSTAAMLAPGLSVKAEIIMGMIQNYNPQSKQATISLGTNDGVGKYDLGKIKLTSLDSPDVKFIGANIVVVSVTENSAVVEVREAPGVQVPIQQGAEITLDTNSGLARREEEAKIIAAQQAEVAQREEQLESARAEKARRQQELEAAREAEIRRQQEIEAQRIAAAQRQREQEAARTEEARRQQQIEAERLEAERIAAVQRQEELEAERTEEARRQQELESIRIKQPTQRQPGQKPVDLNEAQNLWREQTAKNKKPADTADLPLDYLQAYTNAREQPSPETHYKFAEVLINYEIFDQALTWLDETQQNFPATKEVNNLYRAVALVQQGKIEAGQNLFEETNLPNDPLIDEFKSYIYSQKGQWEQVFALSETQAQDSAVIYNNRLIALYCTKPFTFERDTDLSPSICPFGSPVEQPVAKDQDLDDDEEMDDEEIERAQAESNRNREALIKIGSKAIAAYPEDPYILNTLGFIALQSEDYQLAYEYYQELAVLLDRYESTPPRLQLVKANAIKYVNNYNQNYEFLAENGQDLESLRSNQNSVSDIILIGGAGSLITSALTNDVSPVGIIGGVLSTFLRFNQSKSRAKDITEERNSIADQMHLTFTKDIDLLAAPPDLEAKSLLNLSFSGTNTETNVSSPKSDLDSPEIDQKMRQFDDFWQKN